MILFRKILFLLIIVLSLASCSEDAPNAGTHQKDGFAKGADVSWITQFENEGRKFYAPGSRESMECMKLLRDYCGVNAIRLRVWVDPADGWCNVEDVLVKARRAKSLGLRLMIDFHFSDSWADPGKQNIPKSWESLEMGELSNKMVEHIHEMLYGLKDLDIEPEWVQLGNETRNGMLWPIAALDKNPENFARLISKGYDAVKEVFPQSKVVIHCDKGTELWLYTNLFGTLEKLGAKYDMIGMSLYPEASNWQKVVSDCLNNIKQVNTYYHKNVIICEVGMHYRDDVACSKMLTKLKDECVKLGYVDGIFYWEPECPGGIGLYDKGCFIGGSPTSALDCFKN